MTTTPTSSSSTPTPNASTTHRRPRRPVAARPTLRRSLQRALVSQFAHPRGPLGTVAGRIMASRGSNVERNRWLVDLLDLGPGHRVLEVGFGPGVAIAFAAEAAPAGQIVGIDHSATMVDQATARNRDAVALGRVCLHQGSAEHPPAELGRFDRIHGMNVWQFWDDQEAVIAGLVDHLHPGGVLAIGFQPRSRGATAADTDAAARCLIDQFTDAGLLDVCSHQLDLAPVPVAAVLGCHPGT